MRPSPGVAERRGFGVHRRIAVLDAPVVSPAEQRSPGVEQRTADRHAALGLAQFSLLQGHGEQGVRIEHA